MLLMIDNYDSFTYNLVQYLGELGADVHVHRNDAITLEEIAAWRTRADRDLARAVHAERGRHFGAADPALRRADPDPRRLPRPPGDRPGLRRAHRARAARDARQAVADRTHDGGGVFAGLPIAVRGDALPLARDRARVAAGRARSDGQRPTTARSWACGIASSRSKASSSIPEAILTEHGMRLLANFLQAAGAIPAGASTRAARRDRRARSTAMTTPCCTTRRQAAAGPRLNP